MTFLQYSTSALSNGTTANNTAVIIEAVGMIFPVPDPDNNLIQKILRSIWNVLIQWCTISHR